MTSLEESPDPEVVETLIRLGADVNGTDRWGSPALHNALKRDRKEILGILLSHNADVNCRDGQSRSLLHWAVVKNDAEMAEFLISQGCGVDSGELYGSSPLIYAACSNTGKSHLRMMDTLLSHGADLNLVNQLGVTAVHCLGEKDDLQMFDLVLKYKEDVVAVEGEHRMSDYDADRGKARLFGKRGKSCWKIDRLMYFRRIKADKYKHTAYFSARNCYCNEDCEIKILS